MALVKMHNKARNITYVYESESYWDKDKKAPRSRRRLVGKIDPETGEVVPTSPRGRGRRPDGADVATDAADASADALRRRAETAEREAETLRAELEACRRALLSIRDAADAAAGAS